MLFFLLSLCFELEHCWSSLLCCFWWWYHIVCYFFVFGWYDDVELKWLLNRFDLHTHQVVFLVVCVMTWEQFMLCLNFLISTVPMIGLICARNAFNSVNRVTALWNAGDVWPMCSHFLFNTYQGYVRLFVHGLDQFLLSRKGVTQRMHFQWCCMLLLSFLKFGL